MRQTEGHGREKKFSNPRLSDPSYWAVFDKKKQEEREGTKTSVISESASPEQSPPKIEQPSYLSKYKVEGITIHEESENSDEEEESKVQQRNNFVEE